MGWKDGQYRYTPRGTTWKPCPACGQEPRRSYKIGSICEGCHENLEWVKAERARYVLLRDVALRAVPEAHRINVPHPPGGNYHDEERKIFEGAAKELGGIIAGMLESLVLATGGAAEIYATMTNNPYVIQSDDIPSGSGSYDTKHRKILLRSEHAAAFDRLVPVLWILVQTAYASGVKDGKDLLRQLSSGLITLDSFNAADVSLARNVQERVKRAERVGER